MKEKFREFYKLIEDAKNDRFDIVVVAWPEVLGDDYSEIIENLSLIADAHLTLAITGRRPIVSGG